MRIKALVCLIPSTIFVLTLHVFCGLCDGKTYTINYDWLTADLNGIERVFNGMPHNGFDTTDELLSHLKEKWTIEREDRSFNSHMLKLRTGCGYISIYINALEFNGRICLYDISIFKPQKEEWLLIRKSIVDKLKMYNFENFKEKEMELHYRFIQKDVLETYYEAVANELGAMLPIEVPQKLKKAYEYLISPSNNSHVSDGMCGLDFVEAKTSMDLLIKARRVDLLQNILRGYNPGGRIYAAIALLRMTREGLSLEPEINKTIEKVGRLEVPITACAGCFSKESKGKEVIQAFVDGHVSDFIHIRK